MSSCNNSVSISDNPDSAAAQDNQIAQSLIFCVAATVVESGESFTGTPNRVPLVAKPWLVVTDMDIVMVAAKATTERKSLKGISLSSLSESSVDRGAVGCPPDPETFIF
jgi:hypothetical protein